MLGCHRSLNRFPFEKFTLKKPLDWSYELHVFGTNPKALPLADFAELAKRFADLLGSSGGVHFGALRPGSARILAVVDPDARLDVKLQLVEARNRGSAYGRVQRLDDYLRQKGLNAEVRNRDGGTELTFAGAKAANDPEVGRLVQQLDSVVGQVIKIGGRDETVPMTIETSDGTYVEVNIRGRELAKRLAPYLFGKDIRVTGLATWKRDGDGQWSCTSVMVDEFTELDTTSVTDLFDRLGELPDNGWNQMDDPVAEWKKTRGED